MLGVCSHECFGGQGKARQVWYCKQERAKYRVGAWKAREQTPAALLFDSLTRYVSGSWHQDLSAESAPPWANQQTLLRRDDFCGFMAEGESQDTVLWAGGTDDRQTELLWRGGESEEKMVALA
jgi:hypothetical protein